MRPIRVSLASVAAAIALLTAAPALCSAAVLGESIMNGLSSEPGKPGPAVQFFSLGDSAGVDENITVSFDAVAQAFTIADSTGISPDTGEWDTLNGHCTPLDANTVRCRVDFSNATVAVDHAAVSIGAQAGNDTITATGGGYLQVLGGPGNDVISTSGGDDYVRGGDGTDTIDTGDGNDTVDDGLGSDVVRTGGGKDVISVFGGGVDSIDAGDGDDEIAPYDTPHGTVNILAGAGNDTANVMSTKGVVDMGAGNDIVQTYFDTRTYRGEVVTTVTCGVGRDLVTPGPGDRIHLDCEQLNHPDIFCSTKACRVLTGLFTAGSTRPLVAHAATVRGTGRYAPLSIGTKAVIAAVAHAHLHALSVTLALAGPGLYLHKDPRIVLLA